MSGKNRFYVVWRGKTPGVYDNWTDCKKEVEGVQGALYKGFPDRASAEEAYAQGFSGFGKTEKTPTSFSGFPFTAFIAVDAACSGNPGKMEYQGVFVDVSTQPPITANVFKSKVFENGTNNIGEFLAIVHALAWMKQKHLFYPIYSDSLNAQKWVRMKQCRTKLAANEKNTILFEVVARAEKWLRENDGWMKENADKIPVLKWKTEVWGEIPADFGRK